MKKRLFSFLLALCMIVSVFPVTAWATETEEAAEIAVVTDEPAVIEETEEAAEESEIQPRAATATSGECGMGVKWSLSSSGTLTISGSGKMLNYRMAVGSTPWSKAGDVKKVVIKSGVTNIGEAAFWGESKLTSVTIASSVTTIGDNAFADCYNLTEITLPSGLTSIGAGAFGGTGITSITVPKGVTEIPEYLFSECFDLTSVTIKGKITNIGQKAFYDCPDLKKVTIAGAATDTEIGDQAFYNCNSLAEISIPKGVWSIGQYAFGKCTGLKSVSFPSTLTNIYDSAFDACSSLTSITLPSSVDYMPYGAFSNCTSLKEVTAHSATVAAMDFLTFRDCEALESFHIIGKKPKVDSEVNKGLLADAAEDCTVYYDAGTTGWGDTFCGRPTAVWGAEAPSEPSEPSEPKPLEAPAVTASNVASTGKIRLDWAKVEGAVKYEVYRASSAEGTYSLKYTTSGNGYANTGAKAGETYWYYVVAIAENGETAKSAVVSRTCTLAQPAMKIGNVASTGKIRLAWEAVPGAVKYEVYRADSKDGEYILKYTTTGTGYTNTGAKSGQSFYYKVKAVAEDPAADSAFSVAKGRTCDLPRPAARIGNDAASGKVVLAWDAVDGAQKYQIVRSVGQEDSYVTLATVEGTRYVDETAEAGVKYSYKVKALASNTAADSAYSAVKARVCDLPQPEIKVNLNTKGKPSVTWEKIEGAVSYQIYRSTSLDGTYKKIYTATSTRFVNSGAASDVTYYYKIRAVCSNTSGNSAFSEAKFAAAALGAPEVSITLTNKGKPKLTWNKVDGAVKYEVYRATSPNGTYSLKYTTTGTGYSNTGAAAGKTYYYKVRAIAGEGASDSAFSEMVFINCSTVGISNSVAVNEVIARINKYREYAELPPLQWYDEGLDAAKIRAAELVVLPSDTQRPDGSAPEALWEDYGVGIELCLVTRNDATAEDLVDAMMLDEALEDFGIVCLLDIWSGAVAARNGDYWIIMFVE